ncbi:MAG TPA: hypothetical protein VJN89_15630 [Candidatus Acidoferrum sp.]|nr:hypothetical protein [Candidatus Acidoferrum sp.]
MQPRIDCRKYAQEPLQHMLALEKYISEIGLDPKLVHLLKATQCLDGTKLDRHEYILTSPDALPELDVLWV